MLTQESKRRSHLQYWDGTQRLNADTLPDAVANQQSQGPGQGVKMDINYDPYFMEKEKN